MLIRFVAAVEWQISTEAEMEALGRKLSAEIGAGEVIGLVGGLGAGKTHFTKGLAAGMGHEGEVTSPTFALVHEYRAGRLPIFHLDFYRLGSADELVGIGWDEMLDEQGVVVAEWADRFPEMLPENSKLLDFKVLANGCRSVTLRA